MAVGVPRFAGQLKPVGDGNRMRGYDSEGDKAAADRVQSNPELVRRIRKKSAKRPWLLKS
jgi:hypothetical protein